MSCEKMHRSPFWHPPLSGKNAQYNGLGFLFDGLVSQAPPAVAEVNVSFCSDGKAFSVFAWTGDLGRKGHSITGFAAAVIVFGRDLGGNGKTSTILFVGIGNKRIQIVQRIGKKQTD